MARTVAAIKKTMTDAFMADATIREKYGLKEGSTWNGSFSSVSLENIIFFIVAACCHVLESIFELYIKDVDEKISMAVVASVPWYYKMAKAFQYGDQLVLNETTQQYGYAIIDESKQVVDDCKTITTTEDPLAQYHANGKESRELFNSLP